MSAKSAKIPAKPAKPAKDTVYVDVDDDITAIIGKVEAAKNKVVALVLPKRSTALQSIVNMRLLKRNADDAEKSAVLITNEESLLPLAGAAGIHVAKNLQSIPEVPPPPTKIDKPSEPAEDLDEEAPVKPAKIDYNRSMGELAAAKTVDEPETITLDDEDEMPEKNADTTDKAPPKDKRLKIPNFEKLRLLIILGIAGFVGLIVFIILALFVWPHATITVQTESLPVSANFTLNATDAAKTLDETKNNIPATLKTSDQTSTAQVTATGQQNNGTKATGTITASTVCTGLPSPIPAGTGVSSNGLTFITGAQLNLSSVTPSGGHFVCSGNVSVTAQQGGAKYNLAANSNFSFAGYPDVTATNGSAFTGGTDNIVTILSQTDLDNATKNATSSQTASTFTNKFQSDLANQGYYVISATLKPADPVVTSTPSVGQPASTATVNIKVTYSVLAVQKTDLRKIVGDKLIQQVDQNKQKLSNDDVLQGLSLTVSSQGSPSSATLSASEQTTAIPILDQTGIKKQAAGQKTGDIASSINSLPGVKKVDVKLSPFWVSKAPKAGKISIVLQQASN